MNAEGKDRAPSPANAGKKSLAAPVRTVRRDIEERTFAFGVRILRLVRALPRDVSGVTIGRQIARSGTSIGANTEEARAAHSRREFVRMMNIARKEARETYYWLRMIRDVGLVKPTLLTPLIRESEELLKIITAIVKKASSSAARLV